MTNADASPTLLNFEHPLNERIRTFLRLEFLFLQANHHLDSLNEWDSRHAITTLLDVNALLSRGDVKSEVIKELERQTKVLSRLHGAEGVDIERLNDALAQLGSLSSRLHQTHGLGQMARDNDFLSMVKQRNTIPGGTCEFDLPSLHFWLQTAADQQQQHLNHWYTDLMPLRDAIFLVLHMIRSSAVYEDAVGESGSFHRQLEASNPPQLLRMRIAANAGVFPEVSGGKHRFSIRFLEQPELAARPIQSKQSIAFQLASCMM